MKLFKNVLIFLFFLLVGFGGLYTYLSSNPKLKSIVLKEILTGSKFSLLDAPKMSLKARITNFSGEVNWKSRIGDDFEKVISPSLSLQQGESLKTGIDGEITINFDQVSEIILGNSSSIDIVQTIPNDLVFSQYDGKIEYKKLSSIPVSVRAKRLLIEVLSVTKIQIDGDLISVWGDAKIAYNNNANITKVLEVPKNKSLIFNNQSLKVVVK